MILTIHDSIISNAVDELFKFEKYHPTEIRWKKSSLREWYESGGNVVWLGNEEGIIGNIMWGRATTYRTAYITSITIKTEHQGKGYAKILALGAFSIIKENGFETVDGHAREGASIETFRKLGASIGEGIPGWSGTKETYFPFTYKL
jgi:ribosomal protein S18 acetylase RimI-like enzyme